MDVIQTAIAESQFELAVTSLQNYYKEHFCKLEDDLDDVYVELLESVENKLKMAIKRKNEIAVNDGKLSDIER